MVKLIAITNGAGELEGKTAQEIISYAARVSNPSNQNNFETAPKLLAYCIKHQHWSIFEQASITMEIKTSRGIAAQILRHKSFQFQEYCISGDSKITCGFYNKNGKFVPHYIPIKKLYEKQNHKNYKNILLRVYNETTKEFTSAPFKEVFFNGQKECFKITLEDGKTITTTKEHKFLTKKGFLPLEEALNLKINNKTITMENPLELATNGIPCYQSYEWLKQAKEQAIKNKTGVPGIAMDAGVSYHTIRKWLKKLNLTFTKKETASMYDVWNKNKTGYTVSKWSEESKLKKRLNTKKGNEHHSFKGGAHSERKAIANFFNPIRNNIFKIFNYTCQLCYNPFNTFDGKIDLHHIKEVGLFPELAKDINNIIPVHRKCHMEHHGKSYYFKQIRKGHKGNKLAPKYQRVIRIEYIGMIDTYDIEVDHESHNYVANKICVHNSQRYSQATNFVSYEARRQDLKNKQNSIEDMSEEDKEWFKNAQRTVWLKAYDLYDQALSRGIAKECARNLLPLGTETTLYMTGTVRSWIHYIQVRASEATQKEHRDIANACKVIFCEQMPDVAKALGWLVEDASVV